MVVYVYVWYVWYGLWRRRGERGISNQTGWWMIVLVAVAKQSGASFVKSPLLWLSVGGKQVTRGGVELPRLGDYLP